MTATPILDDYLDNNPAGLASLLRLIVQEHGKETTQIIKDLLEQAINSKGDVLVEHSNATVVYRCLRTVLVDFPTDDLTEICSSQLTLIPVLGTGGKNYLIRRTPSTRPA